MYFNHLYGVCRMRAGGQCYQGMYGGYVKLITPQAIPGRGERDTTLSALRVHFYVRCYHSELWDRLGLPLPLPAAMR